MAVEWQVGRACIYTNFPLSVVFLPLLHSNIYHVIESAQESIVIFF